jgi:phosphocarrier protein
MVSRTVTILNRTGLHARPAALFAQAAGCFSATIRVLKGSQQADARSVLALMLLAAGQGTEVTIEAEGEDEEAAVTALAGMLESDFDRDDTVGVERSPA